jgi:hypothetical protein
MKQSVFFVFLLFSLHSNSNEIVKGSDCAYRSDRKVTLEVDSSFSNKYKYVFSQLEQSDRYCLSFIKYNSDKISIVNSIELSPLQEKRIIDRYKQAIDFPLDDEYSKSIKDGELWFIDSSLFQEFHIKISSPTYETQKRGYSKLLDFKVYLASHFE